MYPNTAPSIAPSSYIDLSVSCRKLKDLDILSKSDPQVILFQKRRNGNKIAQWQEMGRTEIVKNNLNPRFAQSFRITYHFEELQELKFVVVDVDKPNSSNLRDQDLIGVTLVNLSEIVGAPGQVATKKLVQDEKRSPHSQTSRGLISIRAEEVAGTQDMVHFELEARKLDKKDFFGLSDPFLVISRGNIEDTGFTPVYKSDVHKNTLNVKWKPFAIPVAKLCNGDYARALKFEVLDWNRSGKEDHIGEYHTNLRSLLQMPAHQPFLLVNPSKKAKQEKKGKSYKGSGSLFFNRVQLEKVSSFLDYVRGGYELNLTVAIDFTHSNKPAQQPDSLHFMQQGRWNGYQSAIQSVGQILLDYDKDKAVAVYGFGARILQNGAWNVSHCFPCNFNWQNPEVMGLEGIMQAYNYAIQNSQFYGPTNFSDVIRQATAKAKRDAQSAYQVLLILTDGAISDMQQTVDAIVDASYNVPLSIVIVGIGNADFSKMDDLDADNHVLQASNGRRMHRDIVQFVPFNKYAHDMTLLTAEVLREIPSQFLSYMRTNKIPAPEKREMDFFSNYQDMGQPNAPPPQQQPMYGQQAPPQPQYGMPQGGMQPGPQYGQQTPPQPSSNYPMQQGSIQYGVMPQGGMQQGPQYGQQAPPQPQYGVQQPIYDPQGGQFQQQPGPQQMPPFVPQGDQFQQQQNFGGPSPQQGQYPHQGQPPSGGYSAPHTYRI